MKSELINGALARRRAYAVGFSLVILGGASAAAGCGIYDDLKKAAKNAEDKDESGGQTIDGSGDGKHHEPGEAGACYHRSSQTCTETVYEECLGSVGFYGGATCAEIDPQGACLDNLSASCQETGQIACQNEEAEDEFDETDFEFLAGQTCAEADPAGACIDDLFGGCEAKTSLECDLISYEHSFYEGQTCAQVDPTGACVDKPNFGGGCAQETQSECIPAESNITSSDFYEGQTCDAVDPLGACTDVFDDCEVKRESVCAFFSNNDFVAGGSCI